MPSVVRCNTHLTCLALGEVISQRIISADRAASEQKHECKFDLLADCSLGVCNTIGKWIHDEWPVESSTFDLAGAPSVAQELWSNNRSRSCLPMTVVARGRNGAPHGTVTLENDDMKGRDDELRPWLAACYVEESYRRSGLGRALVRYAADLAQRLGIKRLHLWFPQDKPHLRRFYELCGWKFLEEAEYEGSSFGRQVVIMRLEMT
eukprot:gnl/MRDRNA2_/MRDRNA2_266210_c0_seq1.p1 gnl/MRDRNA2_/MRDRNA2_266210_c0~~gnl/MRDRNA2_/MRDRNA2_266210_c0_seq1.p1  ORF type:complete len:231 (+),score=31.08 gnl/MRDRNA2_/MRDRNA2_266210_c0_seq1:78-695(+)